MSRRSQKGGFVSSLSSASNEVLQNVAHVELESRLRVEVAPLFLSPAPTFVPGYPVSSIFADASHAPPSDPGSSSGVSAMISSPRPLGGDPRLKAAMARLLNRMDGTSTSSVGVFKARPPPLTTSAVMSIPHKVDNDLRRKLEGERGATMGTPLNLGARFGPFSASDVGSNLLGGAFYRPFGAEISEPFSCHGS